MTKGCHNCLFRSNEAKEACYKGECDLYYPCAKKSHEGVTVRVTLDHKPCREWKPNPYYFMTWQQIKGIVKVADQLIEQCKEQGWDEEQYYTEVLHKVEFGRE